MAHPEVFDRGDPLYTRVRATALAFPGAAERISHGRPAFFTAKVFAYWTWSERASDGWVQHPHALVVQPADDERLALLDAGAWLPPYLAGAGWVAVDLDAAWAERIEELLDMSYRRTAAARLVRDWDQRGQSGSVT